MCIRDRGYEGFASWMKAQAHEENDHADMLAQYVMKRDVYKRQRLCTAHYPMKCAFKIQIYCGRIGIRVISTNFFSKFTITWSSYVCDND